MIHKIWANDKRFKTVKFSAGLNVILAERTPESSDKDTCNGAGKTTLLNIIHFLFGANLSGLGLPKDDLQSWSFYMSLDLGGKAFTAKRAVANEKIVEVEGEISKLPITPETDSRGISFYKNNDWKNLLGKCLFKIGEESATQFSPSFRSLISYFARRRSEAYLDPFSYLRMQSTCDRQISNAFLLGLNWLHAAEAEGIRRKEKILKFLNTEIWKDHVTVDQGKLEAERVHIEHELKQESDAISSFNVHPQYKELQEQANQLTKRMHDLANKSLLMRRKLEMYEKISSEEKISETDSVEKLFSEAGIYLEANIKRTLKEAKQFHKAIILNRKQFLAAEIAQLINQLSSIEENIKEASKNRAEVLQILKTHGALEEFYVLQERMIEKKERLEAIRNDISKYREMDQKRQDIKSSKIELEKKLERDYDQSQTVRERAIVLFNENSQALYDNPGNLIINTTDNGYKFEVEIPKSTSDGVGKMKIYCYDMMLVELMSKRGGINFLFHDSSIFDGVDSRQIALALMHAKRKALNCNFQYICALNSDAIPRNDFDEEFNLDEHVRLTLNDQRSEDSMLGFHFEIVK